MNSSFEQVSLLSHPASQSSSLNWQQIPTNYPQCKSIHQLFEAQVEQVPDATAIVFENQRLTYKELNKKANQLAHYLQNLGVQPDVLVGICVERSLETVICILAILKAGGAYVPLDPTYPAERIAYSLADAQISILLTTEKHLAKLPVLQGQVVCLDQDWQEIAQQSSENPDSQVQPSNLAYVIYTSGSTGQPKGVLIEHGNVIRLFAATQAWYNFSHNDVWTLFHSYAFDFSVWEIWGALLHGGKLVVVPYIVSRSPDAFYQLLQTEGVTVLNQTPSAFVQLIQVEQSSNIAAELNLRLVIFGGEALDLQSLKPWFERHGDRTPQLVNMYGITETTVHVTYRPLQISDLDSRSSVIGCPIRDLKIHLLDSSVQPVAIGEVGEMYIEGAGLARGYLNREELTQERFIPNPFSNDPESKLYKSGDLAKYLPNGDLEYLGRIDHQVKIRGFRIELGEIETVLTSYDEVGQTVAVVREDRPGDKLIVAYVVPRPHCTLQGNTLRQFLQGKLPEYMIPSAFVILESFPLTSNGKIDKGALPAPNFEKSSTEYIPPRTAVEEKVAQIWTEVLKLERIGVNNNFFELGGHSLLATQIISRCHQAFSVEMLLQSLFENPTIATLAQTIVQYQNLGTDSSQYQTIFPRNNLDSAPLSFAQQRLWFLDQLEPNNTVYHISRSVRLSGDLNIQVLKQALDAIVAHHEILRTNYIAENGNPIQVIAAPQSVELPIIDLQQYGQAEQETQIQKLLQQERQCPFDLASDMVLRGCLLKLAPQEHVLLLVVHHIAFDGWSIGILWEQLTQLYQAFLDGQPNPLEPLPIQYADYAVWQREWLTGEVLDKELNYWKQQLAGSNPVLELPTDYPRPAVQTYRGASQSLTLPPSLSDGLKQLCRQQGVTLYMTLLAVFATLLHRYTGQEDILIGSPVAGRNRAEIEGLIGFFINTVVLRANFSQEPSFRSLLAQVREVALGAYAHQGMPFEKLVEELQIERDTSRNPLFQVWFNMLNLEDIQLKMPSIDVESIYNGEIASKFDLTLYVAEQEDTVKLRLVYNTDLFSPERMLEMLNQYHHLLSQIVENPDISTSELSLVTPQAKLSLPNPKQQLPWKWEGSVHSRFSQQAQWVPQHLAVVDAQVAWTYSELEERVNQLANYLLANNIKKQDIVAIYGHRSANLVWAILGVLKAGAAFAILDPAYPNSRLINCLQLFQPRALIQIAAEELPTELQEYVDSLSCECSLNLPQDSSQVASSLLKDYATYSPEVTVEPDHLAYVAFTSGSTGKPKGILGTHRPLSHFLQWHCQTFELNQSDRFSMLSGLSHDPLLRDIFTPLFLGATLYIPEQQDIQTSHKLFDWMQEKQVSIAHLTPAMAQLLTLDNTANPTKYLRYLFFGGDILTLQNVDRIRNFAPAATCINFYGATETPQAMGYYIVPKEDNFLLLKDNVPLGQGIEDVQLLLLNTKQQLAGIGEVAQIHVRTPYLSKGYIGNDELTDEKFIVNPFTRIADDILYKTGDLGRYLPDGNIEFLGRIDNQVKIRGFRIELGEIESVFNTHPQIQQAIVIAREDIPGDKRLVAYVVPQSEQPHDSDLRSFLAERLPNYMVPSAFVFLDAMPLTPNGKVDRRVLPAPNQSHIKLETNFIPPSNPTEEILVTIWANVLSLKQVGIHDNFFELGGHSLLALRLFSEIEKVFGRTFPLATLFEAPTVKDLANIIDQKQSLAAGSLLVPIQPQGTKPPLFLIHALGSSILIYHNLAQYLTSEQPVYGIQPQGLNGEDNILTTVEEIAAFYLQEIQKIQPEGPYFLGGYSFGGKLAFEMARQLQQQGQEVAFLALIDCYNSLGSQRLPLSQRLKIHLDNLRQGKHQYLAKKMIAWSSWLNYNLKSKSQKIAFQIVKKIGLPLPLTLLNRYIEENNLQANKNYQPRFYPGKITLFQVTEWLAGEGYEIDEFLGWQELSGEKVEIHDVPGDHLSIFEQPQVKILAEKVSTCLERSQMEKSRSQ